MAVSTASAPVFMGSTHLEAGELVISLQKRPSWSLRKAREVRVTRLACSTRALPSGAGGSGPG
jgi:hypothetical protein